jgi:hypothetical protein
MWGEKGMRVHMLAKCAEALALRAAFPQELGDVYSFEELGVPDTQGPDAEEEPIVEVKSENGDKVTVAQLDELRGELKTLEGHPGWAENEVVFAAAKSFNRKVNQLSDLRVSEWEQVIAAARSARGG